MGMIDSKKVPTNCHFEPRPMGGINCARNLSHVICCKDKISPCGRNDTFDELDFLRIYQFRFLLLVTHAR